MKRARPDIEVFSCTRVSRSIEEDWQKLKEVMAFLKITIDYVRVIGSGNFGKLFV